jgi:hypothetical protein
MTRLISAASLRLTALDYALLCCESFAFLRPTPNKEHPIKNTRKTQFRVLEFR